MKSVLIAYDGAPYAESALGDLTRAGLDPDAELTIVTAADVHLPSKVSGDVTDIVAAARGKAQAALSAAEKHAEHAVRVVNGLAPHWKIEPVVVAASPVTGILTEAIERQSEMIVMGAHSHSTLQRWFLGSVSASVAAEAPCSVRICRTHEGTAFQHLRHILAVDGSAGADEAASNVLTRSWPQGTTFHIIAVADSRLTTALASSDSAGWRRYTSSDVDSGAWIDRMLGGIAADFRAAGHIALPEVLSGDPKKALLKHAEEWGAHCIFLGAQGMEHGTMRRLGSLATALAMRAVCNVEIVRPFTLT